MMVYIFYYDEQYLSSNGLFYLWYFCYVITNVRLVYNYDGFHICVRTRSLFPLPHPP